MLLYPLIRTLLSLSQGSFSWYIFQLLEIQILQYKDIEKLCSLSSKWYLHQKDGKILKARVVYDWKEGMFSIQSRTDAHKSWQRLWLDTEHLHRFKPDKFPAVREERRHKLPPLPRSYLQVIATGKGIIVQRFSQLAKSQLGTGLFHSRASHPSKPTILTSKP